MSLNLSRNTRLWVSTSNTTHDNSNTFEIPIQDGYSLGQNMSSEDISPEEAGPVPTRGSRRFNTALDPVDWSFSTYLNPFLSNGDVMAIDAILWHAIATDDSLPVELEGDGAGGAGQTDVYTTGSTFKVGFTKNSAHVLKRLYLYFKIDNKVYRVDEAQVNEASIPLDIADIAMTNWSGQGTKVTEIPAPAFMSSTGDDYSSASPTVDSFVKIPSNKSYILSKLTTVSMQSDASGSDSFYNIALTGGTLTISNGISYVTPSTLSEVDVPVGSFTGTFDVSGSMDSYLRDGIGLADGSTAQNAYGSSDLLSQMASNREVVNVSNITFELGGKSNPARVEINLPQAQIGIPAMSVDSIVSQSLEFKAIPSSANMNDGDEINLEFFNS
jgi:hypothetical protein